MINELASSPTRSENFYFANNEHASIDDRSHLLLCFVLYMPNII